MAKEACITVSSWYVSRKSGKIRLARQRSRLSTEDAATETDEKCRLALDCGFESGGVHLKLTMDGGGPGVSDAVQTLEGGGEIRHPLPRLDHVAGLAAVAAIVIAAKAMGFQGETRQVVIPGRAVISPDTSGVGVYPVARGD